MLIPVLQDKDGIFKTCYDPIGKKYLTPVEGKPTLGLNIRCFSSIAELKKFYPGVSFTLTRRVVENTKVAPPVDEAAVERAQAAYDKKATPQAINIPEDALDKLADLILKRLEDRMKPSNNA